METPPAPRRARRDVFDRLEAVPRASERPWGDGTYRRRILVRRAGARAWGELEDDFHHFRVELRHDGSLVTDVVGSGLRSPWTTCLDAGVPLRTLVGTRLTTGPLALSHLDARQNCTHMFDLAGLTGTENVYDLYCGAGITTLYLAGAAKHVAGVELVPESVADAKVNAEFNKITNVSFTAGDMKKIFDPAFVAAHGRPDVVVTDPPRAGMDEPVVRHLLELDPPVIIYVSCNPATQARDLAILKERYRIDFVQPVDMFPHTYHVENVVRLVRR